MLCIIFVINKFLKNNIIINWFLIYRPFEAPTYIISPPLAWSDFLLKNTYILFSPSLAKFENFNLAEDVVQKRKEEERRSSINQPIDWSIDRSNVRSFVVHRVEQTATTPKTYDRATDLDELIEMSSRRAHSLPPHMLEPAKPERGRCVTAICFSWKVITCVVSHVTLILMVVCYCVGGAYLFQHLEGEHETEVRCCSVLFGCCLWLSSDFSFI